MEWINLMNIKNSVLPIVAWLWKTSMNLTVSQLNPKLYGCKCWFGFARWTFRSWQIRTPKAETGLWCWILWRCEQSVNLTLARLLLSLLFIYLLNGNWQQQADVRINVFCRVSESVASKNEFCAHCSSTATKNMLSINRR